MLYVDVTKLFYFSLRLRLRSSCTSERVGCYFFLPGTMSLSWLGRQDMGGKSLGSSSWEVAPFRVWGWRLRCTHPYPFGGL